MRRLCLSCPTGIHQECLSVAHRCSSVPGITLHWPPSSKDEESAGLELELILTWAMFFQGSKTKPSPRKTHLPLAVPELCFGMAKSLPLCACSLRLLTSVCSLHPLPNSGCLSWQVSPEQSPPTQILACMVAWTQGSFLAMICSLWRTLCCS